MRFVCDFKLETSFSWARIAPTRAFEAGALRDCGCHGPPVKFHTAEYFVEEVAFRNAGFHDMMSLDVPRGVLRRFQILYVRARLKLGDSTPAGWEPLLHVSENNEY